MTFHPLRVPPVAVWLVVLVAPFASCTHSEPESESRGVASSEAGKNPDARPELGEAGEASVPCGNPPRSAAPEGAAGMFGDVEFDGASGAGAGGASGPVRPPASSGGTGEVEDRGMPRCRAGQQGPYCGQHLSPKGDTNTRYFCDAELGLLAQAACPGVCDSDSSTCKAGSGTGSGQGDYTRPAARCLFCYSDPCQAQSENCQADALCLAHYTCLTECDASQACADNCREGFASEALLDELVQCALQNGCAPVCAAVF